MTLKLIEKYEKKWIKTNILNRESAHSESLANNNLTIFNMNNKIKFESKNKFNSLSKLPKSQKDLKEVETTKEDKIQELFSRNSGFPISKKQETDQSLEIDYDECLEMETNEASGMNSRSEYNEEIEFGVCSYSGEMPILQIKNAMRCFRVER